jgi:hypothetical protein
MWCIIILLVFAKRELGTVARIARVKPVALGVGEHLHQNAVRHECHPNVLAFVQLRLDLCWTDMALSRVKSILVSWWHSFSKPMRPSVKPMSHGLECNYTLNANRMDVSHRAVTHLWHGIGDKRIGKPLHEVFPIGFASWHIKHVESIARFISPLLQSNECANRNQWNHTA